MLPATPIISLGKPLIELGTLDSTNIYAMRQIQEQLAVSGSCYRADFQTSGKGQQTKVWESEKGENILCSYVLSLQELKKWIPNPKSASTQDQFGLQIAVSLGLSDFFDLHSMEETTIKWPNDLYWRDRKAGGILIENTFRGAEWNWSVIGIGVNINQTHFGDSLLHPVSLKQITGKSWDIREMTNQLSKSIDGRLNDWLKGEEEKNRDAYHSRLYKLGEKVKFKNGAIQFEGIVKGVNKNGQLIVDKGVEEAYDFGKLLWETEKKNTSNEYGN